MSFSYAHLIDPILKDVRQYAPVFGGMKPGDNVLDVCCGTGAQVIEYGKFGITAIGIDLDQSMLNTALKNIAKQALCNTSFKLADATSLPFEDNSFDYVSTSLALHDKEPETRKKIVAEMKRVVKKDGSLVIIDFQYPLPKNIWGISVRTVEFLAGGSHYQGFKDYMKNGGLGYILETNQLVEEKADSLKSGTMAIVKAKLS